MNSFSACAPHRWGGLRKRRRRLKFEFRYATRPPSSFRTGSRREIISCPSQQQREDNVLHLISRRREGPCRHNIGSAAGEGNLLLLLLGARARGAKNYRIERPLAVFRLHVLSSSCIRETLTFSREDTQIIFHFAIPRLARARQE